MENLDNLTIVNGAEDQPVKKAAKKAVMREAKKEPKYSRQDLENKNIMELRKICKSMGLSVLDKKSNINNILNNQ